IQIEDKALGCAFRIEVFVPRKLRVVPGIAKLTAGKAERLEPLRPVFDKSQIDAHRLARIKSGQSLVRGNRVIYIAAGQREPSAKRLPQICQSIEACPQARPRSLQAFIRRSAENGFFAQPYVAAEADRSKSLNLPFKVSDTLIGAARVLIFLIRN